jgi:hypothetical protein
MVRSSGRYAYRHTQESRSNHSGDLNGRLRDQAELSGVLNSLYNLHLSILKVEVANDE